MASTCISENLNRATSFTLACSLFSEDLIILTFDGADLQYLVALDKRTGKTVWKTDRSVDWNDDWQNQLHPSTLYHCTTVPLNH